MLLFSPRPSTKSTPRPCGLAATVFWTKAEQEKFSQGASITSYRLRSLLTNSRSEPLFEPPTGRGEVIRIQDGRHDADAAGARSDDAPQGFHIDFPHGETGDAHVSGSPTHIAERHRADRGLSGRRVNRTDGDVIRSRKQGAVGLLRRMSAQADSWFGVEGLLAICRT